MIGDRVRVTTIFFFGIMTLMFMFGISGTPGGPLLNNKVLS